MFDSEANGGCTHLRLVSLDLFFLRFHRFYFSGIYLTIVMAMTSVSVIMTVFVLNLHYRGPNRKPVPEWLRKCILGKRSGCQLNCLAARETRGRDEYYSGKDGIYSRNVSLKLTIENIAQELKDELDHSENATDISSSADGGYQTGGGNDKCSRRNTRRNNHQRTNQDILDALKRLVSKQEKEEHDDELMHEWRELAQIVDRVLFWLFFVGTFGSTVLILVVAPAYRFL